MAQYDFDLFTIGAGSAGTRCSRIAGQHGARVAVAEERYLGGTCVNVGCVPKKLLVMASHYAHDLRDAQGFGWSGLEGAKHDWGALIAHKNEEISRLNDVYRRLLEAAKVTIFDQRARLLDAHTVEVGDQRVTAERILIATGGWPEPPDHPGAREYGITSNEVFFLDRLPRHVVIVGGGYIGTEFACLFNGLGSKVTQLVRGRQILAGFDRDIREFLAEEMVKSGLDIRFNTEVTRLDRAGDCYMAELSDGFSYEVDCVIYATGRKPLTRDLGLETVGVELDRAGAVKVNEAYQTSVPSIYAIGDVTNRVNLTPVAIAEGHALADTLFGNRPRDVSYEMIPTAVFSIPPVATCGWTEDQARERLPRGVDVYRSTFRPMRTAFAGRDTRTLMKLVVCRETDRVFGAHMVGADVPEMMQGIGVAMQAGATKADFDRTIGIHPTAAEEFVTMRQKAPDPMMEERE